MNFPLSFMTMDYLVSGLIIKPMTSNAGTNGNSLASSVNSSFAAWKAFDNDSSTFANWQSSNAGLPQWLKYTFNNKTIVTSYQISYQNSFSLPVSWEFQGSNNGSNWDVLDRISGASYPSDTYFKISGHLQSGYTQYRIYITVAGALSASIPEIQFYGYV